MNSQLQFKGTIRIYEDEKLVSQYENLLMRPVKRSFLNVFEGLGVEVGRAAFLAIGTDSKPVSTNDTKLGSEFFRKPITNVERMTDNRLIIETYIENEEANDVNWREIGLFDESGSWEVVDSGILMNRAVINEEPKNSGISKTISWTIEVL